MRINFATLPPCVFFGLFCVRVQVMERSCFVQRMRYAMQLGKYTERDKLKVHLIKKIKYKKVTRHQMRALIKLLQWQKIKN